MKHIKRNELSTFIAPGRKVCTGVAPDLPENEAGMMAGFALFSYDFGKMDTHFHQNEYMYVIDAKDAVCSHGMDVENMETEPLTAGEIVRPAEGEWHRFDFTAEGGYVDFLNFFVDFPPCTVNLADWKKEDQAD